MEKYKLFDAELKFMNIIWEEEPIKSGELVRVCNEKLGWKKSTTYTVLRKLAQRGVLKNENTVVTSIVKREDTQIYANPATVGECQTRAQLSVLLLLNAVLTIF